jgi:D-serine deaminase-like pyridoxal phosphate-dependent protein
MSPNGNEATYAGFVPRVDLLNAVDTPALLLNYDALRANLSRMSSFFATAPARLRPHFKTHKCAHIAKMQMAAGAVGMTCAKVGEAEVLVSAGIRDILIANEVVGPVKIERLMKLLDRDREIKVAVDSESNVRELSRATTARGIDIGVLVEVDVGMGRCGVTPGDALLSLCRFVDDSPNLVFRGLMGYEGHAVQIPDADERKAKATAALETLRLARESVEAAGLDVEIVSAGGTGTYDLAGSAPHVTEVQAGSYVLMDGRYLGIRPEFLPALTLLATIISVPRPGVAVADAGLKSCSTEFGLPEVLAPAGLKVSRLAEEHTLLDCAPDANVKVGQRIALLPSHGCTTVNLHDEYVVIERAREKERWAIEGRGKIQ